jgi:hypothetical protein
MIERDILSTRLENRAQLLTMIARGEARIYKAELRALLHEMAANLREDAKAVGRLERERGRSV